MKTSQKLLVIEEVTKQPELRHVLTHAGNLRDSLVTGKSIREDALMVTLLNAVLLN